MKKYFLHITILSLLFLCSANCAFMQKPIAAAAGDKWEPQRTWVFFVGLLEWKDSENLPSFPQKNRRDEILLDQLRKRGVPESQIVYLKDSQGTTAAIQREFEKMLGKTKPGDTVFVYYCGHGYKDENAQTYFASYDASDETLGWKMASVPDTIEKYFKGSNAIIALDNCYSGAMADAVKIKPRRVSYAVMTSSLASQESTGNWTFTEALISAFRGDPFIDDDHDGKVTFAELESNAEDDMLYGEEQMATFAFTGKFSPAKIIGDAAQSVSPRVGERVEAYSIDGWYKGYITDAHGPKFLVHYYGYEYDEDEWVTAKMIRQPKVTQYAVGQKVEVEWKKKWYPAKVLEVKGGAHYITYADYGSEWDEWVPSNRIRKIKN
jgi:Caspase domain/RNA binding activity-knot of a chromodomain/Agenet domain